MYEKKAVFKTRSYSNLSIGDSIRVLFSNLDNTTGQPTTVLAVYSLSEINSN